LSIPLPNFKFLEITLPHTKSLKEGNISSPGDYISEAYKTKSQGVDFVSHPFMLKVSPGGNTTGEAIFFNW